MVKKARSDTSFDCGMLCPLSFTGSTALGWSMCRNSLLSTRKSISTRMLLNPPVVLPAQAPVNMSTPRMTHVMCGHAPASVFDSPVVVMNDTTWNSDERKARSRS